MNPSFSVSSAGTLPRGRQRTQRFLIATCVVLLLALSSVASAIDVVGGLNGPYTFDDPPVVADWVTRSLAGAGNTATSQAALDPLIQAVTASSITGALPTDTAASPGTNGLARWNSALFAVQTRPTGNAVTLLMGSFINTSDNFISDFLVGYDVAKFSEAATELLGHNVYYSTTGAANSWIPFDNGAGGNQFGQDGGFASFFATGLGQTWGNNPLYILWADDNGDGSSDTAYTIDNLTFEAVLGDPKEPPPPPTPEFGTILPPASNTVDTGNLVLTAAGGEVVTLADGPGGTDNVTYHVRGSLGLTSDQVDLRTVSGPVEVSFDVKTWDTSSGDPNAVPPTIGSDFELNEDSIDAFIDWSTDGLNFQTLQFVELDGGTPEPEPAPPWPSSTDELKPLDNGELGPYTRLSALVPAEAKTIRVRINAVNTSSSEHFYIDNVSVAVVPEPGTVALFGFGALGLIGYGIRRRKA